MPISRDKRILDALDRMESRLDIMMGTMMKTMQAAMQQALIAQIPRTLPPQSDPPATVTQQQSSSPARKNRNKRTRQQHKRKKALRVTTVQVQELEHSVKEVEHTVRVEHENKPGEHVVLQRIKLIPWDWSTTSLWCWYAVIRWDRMTMVLLRCGASGMPRIGIG